MAQKYTRPFKAPLSAQASKPVEKLQPVQFIFNSANYKLLAVSIGIVVLGFILMSGNTDIYSNTKIVVAPLLVLAGFGLAFYAILKKPEVKA